MPRSVFASDGGLQPLIDPIKKNLSQTPREQCEREGLIEAEGKRKEGPGKEVVLAGLKWVGG